ncbi:MAG TPA: hypothetical protein VF142_07545 [Longimicrobium sp.]
MPAFTLSVIQASPRAGLDLTQVVVIAVMLLAVGLVVWASRPSVISRYSASTPDADDPAEKEPRA